MLRLNNVTEKQGYKIIKVSITPINNGFVKKGTVEVIGNIYENPELI